MFFAFCPNFFHHFIFFKVVPEDQQPKNIEDDESKVEQTHCVDAISPPFWEDEVSGDIYGERGVVDDEVLIQVLLKSESSQGSS